MAASTGMSHRRHLDSGLLAVLSTLLAWLDWLREAEDVSSRRTTIVKSVLVINLSSDRACPLIHALIL